MAQKTLTAQVPIVSGQPYTRAIVNGKDYGTSGYQYFNIASAVGAGFYEVSPDYNPNLPEASQTPTWLTVKAGGADYAITGQDLMTVMTVEFTAWPAFRLRGGTSAAPVNFTGNGTFKIYQTFPDLISGGEDDDLNFQLICTSGQTYSNILARTNTGNLYFLGVQGSPGPAIVQVSQDYDWNLPSTQACTWLDKQAIFADNTVEGVNPAAHANKFNAVRIQGGASGLPAVFTGNAIVWLRQGSAGLIQPA